LLVARTYPWNASCAAHERRDLRKNKMHTFLQPVRSGRVGAWPFAHFGRALPLEGLTLEIRLVLLAQPTVHLIHVASDSRSLDFRRRLYVWMTPCCDGCAET